MNALVVCNSVLLQDNLLLHQCVNLLLEEVALVDVVGLQFLEVFLEIGDVFDDLLQNVIGSLCGMVLESCTLRTKELHFFLIVIKQLDSFFSSTLYVTNRDRY